MSGKHLYTGHAGLSDLSVNITDKTEFIKLTKHEAFGFVNVILLFPKVLSSGDFV